MYYYRTMDIRTNWRTGGDCLELEAVDGFCVIFSLNELATFTCKYT